MDAVKAGHGAEGVGIDQLLCQSAVYERVLGHGDAVDGSLCPVDAHLDEQGVAGEPVLVVGQAGDLVPYLVVALVLLHQHGVSPDALRLRCGSVLVVVEGVLHRVGDGVVVNADDDARGVEPLVECVVGQRVEGHGLNGRGYQRRLVDLGLDEHGVGVLVVAVAGHEVPYLVVAGVPGHQHAVGPDAVGLGGFGLRVVGQRVLQRTALDAVGTAHYGCAVETLVKAVVGERVGYGYAVDEGLGLVDDEGDGVAALVVAAVLGCHIDRAGAGVAVVGVGVLEVDALQQDAVRHGRVVGLERYGRHLEGHLGFGLDVAGDIDRVGDGVEHAPVDDLLADGERELAVVAVVVHTLDEHLGCVAALGVVAVGGVEVTLGAVVVVAHEQGVNEDGVLALCVLVVVGEGDEQLRLLRRTGVDDGAVQGGAVNLHAHMIHVVDGAGVDGELAVLLAAVGAALLALHGEVAAAGGDVRVVLDGEVNALHEGYAAVAHADGRCLLHAVVHDGVVNRTHGPCLEGGVAQALQDAEVGNGCALVVALAGDGGTGGVPAVGLVVGVLHGVVRAEGELAVAVVHGQHGRDVAACPCLGGNLGNPAGAHGPGRDDERLVGGAAVVALTSHAHLGVVAGVRVVLVASHVEVGACDECQGVGAHDVGEGGHWRLCGAGIDERVHGCDEACLQGLRADGEGLRAGAGVVLVVSDGGDGHTGGVAGVHVVRVAHRVVGALHQRRAAVTHGDGRGVGLTVVGHRGDVADGDVRVREELLVAHAHRGVGGLHGERPLVLNAIDGSEGEGRLQDADTRRGAAREGDAGAPFARGQVCYVAGGGGADDCHHVALVGCCHLVAVHLEHDAAMFRGADGEVECARSHGCHDECEQG